MPKHDQTDFESATSKQIVRNEAVHHANSILMQSFCPKSRIEAKKTC